MTKYSSIAIVSSFFCLWINSFFGQKFQVFFGFLLIFSFGIMHGANDLVLISSLQEQKQKISFTKILFYYVSTVILGVVSFYFFPKIALLIFIFFSGFHFGEQQFQKIDLLNSKVLVFFQMAYGLFILFLLFYFHQSEVSKIVYDICNYRLSFHQIKVGFATTAILLLLFFLYLYIYAQKIRMKLLQELFYLAVFGIIFICSNLIWGFAIYFVFWHSIPSIMDQINYLQGDYTPKKLMNYFRSAFLYWIFSLIGLAVFYYVFKDLKLFNAIFFSFLAAITFPHVLVIVKMFQNTDQKKTEKLITKQ
jgi:beta-carotene 15,15'-dioxygenase